MRWNPLRISAVDIRLVRLSFGCSCRAVRVLLLRLELQIFRNEISTSSYQEDTKHITKRHCHHPKGKTFFPNELPNHLVQAIGCCHCLQAPSIENPATKKTTQPPSQRTSVSKPNLKSLVSNCLAETLSKANSTQLEKTHLTSFTSSTLPQQAAENQGLVATNHQHQVTLNCRKLWHAMNLPQKNCLVKISEF